MKKPLGYHGSKWVPFLGGSATFINLCYTYQMKKVIIVHGWDGHPEDIWFPWLKNILEERGYEVIIPQLPNPEEPRIKPWVSELAEVAGDVNEDTYFIEEKGVRNLSLVVLAFFQ